VAQRPHRATDPIDVVWDERRRRPQTFVWRGRRRRVDRVIDAWVTETGWWDEAVRVSRRHYRVQSEGRLYDLCYDRVARDWLLEGAVA